MGSVVGDWDDDRYSVIGDKEDVGFLDFKDDKSFLGSDEIDVGPVVISKPFPFVGDKPQSALVGKRTVDLITIKNTTTEPMDLWGVKIYSSTHVDAFYFSLTEPPSATFDDESSGYFFETTALEDRIIQAGQTLNIWFSCKPKDLGLHNAIVHFDVGDDRVERVVFLLADDMLSQSLAGNKPYSKESRKKHFNMERYVPAARIPRAVRHEFRYFLSQFPVPKNVRELVANQQCPEVLTEGLTMKNYCLYFMALLQLEELQMEEDVKAYDMYNVSLRRRGSQYFALEVPGLAEKRPSLVSGDLIYVKLGADNPYQGQIFKVEADEVILKFDPLFLHNHNDSNQYDVRFSSNRLNMRRKYQAVEAAEKLSANILFPSQSFKRSLIKTPPISHLNQSLNEEQKSSVDTILRCRGSPPYIIHGPPGTGKTITLVEAILQLYLNRKDSRVLVCASSNSAADHIFEKLTVRVQENEIFRLNATSRPYEDVRPDIIRYCFFDDSGFKCPPLKALKRYRIIASTYMSASLLYAEGVTRGHFSHIFLDEAGQSSEPETMAPISNLANKETVVVLAGDPMQLGPVIYSKDADNFGLGKSYLERLSECELYDGGDRNFVMKLVRNYRCHPAILELPSNLFYKGELIACKQEDSELPVYEWAELPNKTFPVMFVGIQGCDEREERNPSWFNRIEVSKVVEIIRKLIDDAGMSEEDIGVITPYRQQVLKMKKALESLEFSGIKVGSVEQFQGQERQIIIISTVRSTVKHEDFDRKHNLGFLTNSRRFNVAITRARSLLIIVGNPHIICKDPYWDKLLKRCTENGSYVGCPLPEVEIENYGDEADADEWDQQIPKPFIDEGEWTDDVPWSHTAEGEWGEETRRTVSDEGGWGEESSKAQNILKPVPDEGGWGNDIPYSSTAGGEWGQQTPEPVADEGGWGVDIPCPSTAGGEWGQQTLEPAADEVGWGDDIPCPSAAGGKWGQQTPEPAAYEGGWGVESFKGQETLNPIPDRGRRSDKSFKVQHIRRPVNDEDEWDDRSSNNQETRKPGKWRYQSYKARESPKTVSNEPEWSDWR